MKRKQNRVDSKSPRFCTGSKTPASASPRGTSSRLQSLTEHWPSPGAGLGRRPQTAGSDGSPTSAQYPRLFTINYSQGFKKGQRAEVTGPPLVRTPVLGGLPLPSAHVRHILGRLQAKSTWPRCIPVLHHESHGGFTSSPCVPRPLPSSQEAGRARRRVPVRGVAGASVPERLRGEPRAAVLSFPCLRPGNGEPARSSHHHGRSHPTRSRNPSPFGL